MNYADHLHTLATIANKPSASPRTILIATRRACRLLAGEYGRIYGEHRATKRQRNKLEHLSPLERDRIEALTTQCAALDQLAKTVEASLFFIAEEISADRAGIARSLSFDALCDLLEVNPVDRWIARRHGEGIVHIIGSDSESSHTRRGRFWFDSPPLTAAFDLAIGVIAVDAMAEAQSSTIH